MDSKHVKLLIFLLAGLFVLAACDGQRPSFAKSIPIDTWSHQSISSVAWSPDSTCLAVIAGDSVWLYDLAGSETARRKLNGEGGKATSVAFNAAGDKLAVGLEDGRIQLWSVTTGERIIQFAAHDSPVTSLAFHPDGALLASGAGRWFAEFVPRSEGVETRLWDVASGQLQAVLADKQITPLVSHLAFSPDGTVLAVGQRGHGCASPRCAGGRLRFWQPGANAITEIKAGHEIAFSGDGRFAATLGSIYESGRVKIYEVSTGRELAALTAVPNGFAFDLALSRDGSTAAVVMGEYGRGGQTTYVWDAASGEELAVLAAGVPLALSADGRFLAGTDSHRNSTNWLKLWNIGQRTEPIRLAEFNGAVVQLAFSPDDNWLAVVEADKAGSQLHIITV